MKKRLLSLLVALCMAVTLLPVSALTAWAEEGGSNLKPLQIQSGYPVLDGIAPTTDSQNHEIYTGDGWSYDATAKVLTIAPESPTTYDLTDFGSIHLDSNSILCSAIIEKNATIVNGNFWDIDNPGPSITNYGTITSGTYSMPVINHGTITGGIFYSSVSNESEGTIENGTFRSTVTNNGGTIENGTFRSTVTNNGGTINGGTFKDELTGSGIEPGYTLTAETPSDFSSVSVNGYRNSCYVIPNQASVSVDIRYRFDDTMYGRQNLPPLDVTIDNAPPTLLSDWCESNLNIEFDGNYAYNVTFTAPSANGSTVTISPLTRLVIDKDGYPAKARDWNGNRANYTGEGWKFENDTLTLEPAAKTNYDFTSPELNPHGVAVNCPVTVNSNATITNGIFLKEVTGSALNGVFLNVPNGCENSTKKITVSDNGKITALKMSGEATALDSAANELYVVGQPTGTLYVTLSSGKVREVQLPLTADLELQLNDPKPEPKPEPEPEASTYTLTVKGGTFTYNGGEAMTSARVPVDAEVKVTLNQSAVPEGMVFDLWAIDEASLLGNPAVAYNQESFTIPAGTVAKGSTVTVEAQYRDATIESEPSILGTAAIIGVAGAGTAVIVWQGYRIGMELYEKYFQPTPEETAVVEPTLESQMTDPIS